MTSENPPISLLISVDLPAPEPIPPRLARKLMGFRVVLLGCYEVPDQTTPAQARDQFGEEARSALELAAKPLEAEGAVVKRCLVFTRNRIETIERVAAEEGCEAILIPLLPNM